MVAVADHGDATGAIAVRLNQSEIADLSPTIQAYHSETEHSGAVICCGAYEAPIGQMRVRIPRHADASGAGNLEFSAIEGGSILPADLQRAGKVATGCH